jgi:hypothetical protein
MILDIPSKPGGVSSLIQGLTQGFMQGTMEQEREDRNARLRRELYRQQLDRENANYQRSRADKVADTEEARKYEQGQYATRRADTLAEQLRKQQQDAEQARALAQAGGLPVEQAMPEGVQGPGPMMDYGKVGPQGVGQLIGDRRMRDQNAAMMQDRMADNERQDRGLELRQRAGESAEDYRNRMFDLREQGQTFNQDIAQRRLQEEMRTNRVREQRGYQGLSPADKARAENWGRELGYLYELRRDVKKRRASGLSMDEVMQQILAAEEEQQKVFGNAPAQAPTTTPNDLSGMSEEELRKIIDS